MALDAGVVINQGCIDAYNGFKLSKKYEFVVYKANSKMTEIVVDCMPANGESAECYEKLKGSTSVPREGDESVEYWNMRRLVIESKEPRYATIMVPDSAGKTTLIVWQPLEAGMKKNMVYSATKEKMKSKLEGLQKVAQCNDLEELSFAEVSKRM